MYPKGFSRRVSCICGLALCFASTLFPLRLSGQGAINFTTRSLAANPFPVVAPIYVPEANYWTELHGNATTNGGSTVYSGILLTGTGFTAQLWAAPVGGGFLAPVATTVMRPPGALAGFIVPIPSVTIPGAPD